LAVLTVTSHSIAGTRPRHLPLAALQAALPLPDTLPFKPYLYHYLYLAALDSGQLVQAAHYLIAYWERVPQLPAALQETMWGWKPLFLRPLLRRIYWLPMRFSSRPFLLP
jgi:hypothetical protein